MDGFPAGIPETVVSSKRGAVGTTAGRVLPGCRVAGQTWTAASQELIKPHWCCLAQLKLNVEAVVASTEIEAAATLLVGMLSKRGIDTTAKQLVKLFEPGRRWDPH